MVLVGFTITNGPEDTIVCMNTIAEFYCGFTGTDPNFVVPNRRIVFRSDNGSIIDNDTINGVDIFNLINGLQWWPDLTSGDNNGTNSKLLVGSVNNMTHNQSSYQCVFQRIGGGSVISSVGTMTIVGKTTTQAL